MTQKTITEEEVEYVAGLARLDLSDEEKKRITKDLDGILEYFKDLANASTDDLEIINHYDLISNKKNHFRKDKVEDSEKEVRAGILDNFPDKDGDLLSVQSILTH